MKLRHLLTVLAANTALLAGTAQALTFESASTAGKSTVTDYSIDGLIAFDLDLRDFRTITLNYRVSAADLAAPIDFNSVVRNLSGAPNGLPALRFGILGTQVIANGTVTRFFGGNTQILSGAGSHAISLSFTPSEYLDIEVGNALNSTAGAKNWQLSNLGLREGDMIQIVAEVPEPGSVSLMALGLAGLVLTRRRQR